MSNVIIKRFDKTKGKNTGSKKAVRINEKKIEKMKKKLEDKYKSMQQKADNIEFEINELKEQISISERIDPTNIEGIEEMKALLAKKENQYQSIQAKAIKLSDKMLTQSEKHGYLSTLYSTAIPLELYAKRRPKDYAEVSEETIDSIAEKYGSAASTSEEVIDSEEKNNQELSTETTISGEDAFQHFFQEVSEGLPIENTTTEIEEQATFNSSMSNIESVAHNPFTSPTSPIDTTFSTSINNGDIKANRENFYEEKSESSSLKNSKGFKVKPKQVTVTKRSTQKPLEPIPTTKEPNISSNTNTIEALKQQKMAALRRAQELNSEIEQKNQLLELKTQAMKAQSELYRSKEAALKKALEQLTKQNAEKESQLANLDSKIENVNAQKASIDKDSRALDEMLQELSPQDEVFHSKMM